MTKLSLAAIALLATTSIPTAQATTFDFGIVYDIQSQAQFNTVFGTGTAGYGSPGLYEQTQASPKTVVNVGTGTVPPLLTEYVQNVSPSQQLVFSHFGTNASAIFPGFALSGSTWQYVQTLNSNSTTSPNGFTYQVGGVGTPFDLMSIGLANTQSCSCSTSVDIVGFLGGVQVASQIVGIPGNVVGGNGNPGVPASVEIFTLTDPGFAAVDSVQMIPGAGNVNVNDITIGPVVAPVPIALAGSGPPGLVAACMGLLYLARRRRNRLA
jgi:hypothetical protein